MVYLLLQMILLIKVEYMAAYSFYKVCPINLFKFSNKNIKNKKERFINFLPNLKNKKFNIKKIVNFNYKFSKKNNLNKLINTYKLNFN